MHSALSCAHPCPGGQITTTHAVRAAWAADVPLPAGQTSSGFSCTYWIACRVRMVSSTLRPKARLLMVACWMTPCVCSQQVHILVNC